MQGFPDAGSSRQSSVSELPTSPLMATLKEDMELELGHSRGKKFTRLISSKSELETQTFSVLLCLVCIALLCSQDRGLIYQEREN